MPFLNCWCISTVYFTALKVHLQGSIDLVHLIMYSTQLVKQDKGEKEREGGGYFCGILQSWPREVGPEFTHSNPNAN